MSKFLSLILFVVPTFAFASTNGGGVLSVSPNTKELVYSLGNDGEYQNFIRATWENGKWNLKEQSIVLRDFDSPVHNAIKNSDATRNWAQIQ